MMDQCVLRGDDPFGGCEVDMMKLSWGSNRCSRCAIDPYELRLLQEVSAGHFEQFQH